MREVAFLLRIIEKAVGPTVRNGQIPAFTGGRQGRFKRIDPGQWADVRKTVARDGESL